MIRVETGMNVCSITFEKYSNLNHIFGSINFKCTRTIHVRIYMHNFPKQVFFALNF